MLRSLDVIWHHAIRTTDGLLGQVRDCLFDDEAWVIRWLVVDIGPWLSRRCVLVSPVSLRHPDWAACTLPVACTRAQLLHSPAIDTDRPVTRQCEEQALAYYGYPAYWGASGIWGDGLYPYALLPGVESGRVSHLERERGFEAMLRAERGRHRHDDPRLRSGQGLAGFRVQAADGEIGRVVGLLFEDETWSIRSLLLETGHWWSGHKVLIAPTWITGVQWSEETISVALARDTVRHAPAYAPGLDWTWAEEHSLDRYYQRSLASPVRGGAEHGG